MKAFKTVLFLALIFLSLSISAQKAGGGKQLQAQRIAFMTEQMNLTPEEAQQFWPIYNQYAENLKQIRQNYRQTKVSDTNTDEEVEKFVLAGFDKDQKELDLKKDCYQKLKKIISIRKIQKMYSAEIDFRQEVIQQLKKMKE